MAFGTTTNTTVQTGYAPVNGLQMYYEIHGQGQQLVLLHGAFSGIGTLFGALLPELARTRQVIAFELQAHGHTADIDRPMSTEQMADDVAAALSTWALDRLISWDTAWGRGLLWISSFARQAWCASSS